MAKCGAGLRQLAQGKCGAQRSINSLYINIPPLSILPAIHTHPNIISPASLHKKTSLPHTNKQTNKQTHTQTDRQTDRQTDTRASNDDLQVHSKCCHHQQHDAGPYKAVRRLQPDYQRLRLHLPSVSDLQRLDMSTVCTYTQYIQGGHVGGGGKMRKV